MNILMVSGPGISLKEPYQSGIEAFIKSHANQLARRGHRVDVVARNEGSNFKFNLLNPFKSLSDNQFTSCKHLNEAHQFKSLPIDSYDVIHYNMFYPHLIKAGMNFKKKSILSLHSPADKKRISFYQELSKQEDLTMVAISARIRKQYERALNTNLPLIHNGININDWHIARVRKPRYLLWSARITEEKNVVAAIRLAQNMKVALKIAGRIVDQHYFEREVKPNLNDQIQYVGHVKQCELNTLAQNTIAYLATATWQEPFGLAALEMLASGVPVVGFDTAVPQEWRHESVLTTASLRWQDLVALIEKSKAISPRTCRDFALSMSVEKMTSGYLQLYNKILRSEKVSEQWNHKMEKAESSLVS